MIKLYLHIGPHKTGSTYIQRAFLENRDRLLKLGVNYPSVGLGEEIGGHYGHHKTLVEVTKQEPNALKEYFAQFLVNDINVVSSENFENLNLEQIKKLRAALSTIDVKIVFYYRNYIDLLPSWWQEEVKHGSMTSFFEYVLPHVLRPFVSKILNPAVVLDLYANAFGKENIIVVDYDRARNAGGILAPLWKLLGVELDGVKNEMVNSSLKMEFVEIIRALNAIAHANDQANGPKMRSLFLRRRKEDPIRGAVDKLSAMINEYKKPLTLGGGFFEKSISTDFRKKYASNFINQLSDDLPKREVMVPSDNWILTNDAHILCEDIFRQIAAGELG